MRDKNRKMRNSSGKSQEKWRVEKEIYTEKRRQQRERFHSIRTKTNLFKH
jgi:hypothetical protein